MIGLVFYHVLSAVFDSIRILIKHTSKVSPRLFARAFKRLFAWDEMVPCDTISVTETTLAS